MDVHGVVGNREERMVWRTVKGQVPTIVSATGPLPSAACSSMHFAYD
jgi:hypothetical protein